MKFEDIELNNSVTGDGEELEDFGLDLVEQERSLARACRVDSQFEFCDLRD